jgi:predicted DNA-binding protein
VRLDPARYERLKIYGVRQRRTNQELLVEAIDAFLDGREGQGA